MSGYFEKFPRVNYVFMVDGIKQRVPMTNTMYRFDIRQEVREARETFYPYTWKDDDRIDVLSEFYYDSPDFHWLVMMSSQRVDCLNDFPLDDVTFAKAMRIKYASRAALDGYDTDEREVLEWAKQTVHEYRDEDGDVIDYNSYLEATGDKRIVYVFDYEIERNEQRREIKLIDQSLKGKILNELEKGMSRVANEDE